jgi:uncharacterized membrane protein YgcG
LDSALSTAEKINKLHIRRIAIVTNTPDIAKMLLTKQPLINSDMLGMINDQLKQRNEYGLYTQRKSLSSSSFPIPSPSLAPTTSSSPSSIPSPSAPTPPQPPQQSTSSTIDDVLQMLLRNIKGNRRWNNGGGGGRGGGGTGGQSGAGGTRGKGRGGFRGKNNDKPLYGKAKNAEGVLSLPTAPSSGGK